MGSKSSSPIGGYYPTSQNTSSNTSGSGTQTQTQSPAALAAQIYQKALQNAAGIASTPFQPYQGQLVAGFTPSQIAAQQGFQNAVGMSTPYYTAAQNAYNQSLNYANPANYSQATLSQYMNPYQQDVVNATMNQLANLQNQTTARNTADSVRRGSYGGSGQFMGQSQIANQQALANAQTLAGLNAQNYQNAQQQYNQQQRAAIEAQQQAASGLGNLGTTAQTSYLQALQGLQGSGQTQQQLAQRQLETAYQQWQNALAFPYQQTSYLSGLASGLGPLLGSTTGMDYSSTANQTGAQLGMQPYQNQSGGGGLAGLATTGLGLLGGLLKIKDGGRVNGRQEFANGGAPEDDETPSFTRDLGSMVGTKPYSSAGSYSDDALMSFGSAAKSLPYSKDNPNSYIGRSLKLSKVIPSAKQLLANKLTSAISQSLGTESPNIEPLPAQIKSSFFGGSSDSDEYSGAPGLKSTTEYKVGSALRDKYNNYTSDDSNETSDSSGFSFGNLLSGLNFADGGRVYKDDGGSASTNIPVAEAGKSFGELLNQAYAASPGPQLSPTEQGMPAMPDQSYYTKIQPTFASLTTPVVPYPSSTAAGAASTPSTPANYLDLSNTAASMTAPNLISTMYNQYMNRLPTEDEQNYWQGQLRGGQSTQQMEKTIASDFSSQNKSYIDNLYQKILNRNPNSDEVNFWMGQLQGGASAADIQNAILNSGARQESSVVQGYYPTIANTTVNPKTGLFNLAYTAPYKSQPTPYSPSYSADGGRITKSKGGSLSGSDLYSYLINLGATNKEATMLTAMAKAESGFNPTVSHDRGTGYGLWGHGKDRWSDMQRFTGATRPGWQDQARFALNELRTSPKTALARSTLEKAESPSQITIAGMHFERPQGYTAAAPWLGHNFQGRLGNVQNLMLGKDLGTGPQLNIASGGEPNRQSVMFKEPRTEAPAASSEAPATEEPEKKQGFAELLGSAVGKLTEPSGESSAPKLATAGDLGPISMPTNVGPRAFLDTASLGGAGNMQNRYLDSLLESVLEKTDRSNGGQVRQHFQNGGSDEESRNRFYRSQLEGSAPQNYGYDASGLFDTLLGNEAPGRRDYKTRAELTTPEELEAYAAGASATGMPWLDYARSVGRGLKRELTEPSMGPLGERYSGEMQSYKARQAAAKRLKEAYPEAFVGGQLAGSEYTPTAVDAFFMQPGIGAAAPSALARRAATAAEREAPEAGLGLLSYTPKVRGRAPSPEGAPIPLGGPPREMPAGNKPMSGYYRQQMDWTRGKESLPVNPSIVDYESYGAARAPQSSYAGVGQRPMSRFEANQGYMSTGIPGDTLNLGSIARVPTGRRGSYFTPEDFAEPISKPSSQRPMSQFTANQGYMTSRIPGEEQYVSSMGRAPVRGSGKLPASPTTGLYDENLTGKVNPPSIVERKPNAFDQNMYDAWQRGKNRQVPGRTGPFRPEDFAESNGQLTLYRPKDAAKTEGGFGMLQNEPSILEGEVIPPRVAIGRSGVMPNAATTPFLELNAARKAAGVPDWARNAAGLAGGAGATAAGMSAFNQLNQSANAPVIAEDRPAETRRAQLPPIEIRGRAKQAAPSARPTPKAKSTRPAPMQGQDGQMYWGDWRDVDPFESDPIGNFLDSLVGSKKSSRKRGTLSSPYADGGAVRHAYAKGGTQSQEEEFDPLGDIGRGLGSLGDTISQGLGGLFGGGEESAPVVAADRGDAPSRPERRGFGPISQALIAAGMGMMASPSRSTMRAIGEGGLQGFKVYQAAADEQRKQDLLDAQRESNLAFNRSLAGLDSMRSGTSAPSSSSTAEAPTSPTSTGVTPPVAPVSPVVATDRESDIGNQINQSIARIDWLNTHQPQNADQEKALKHYIEAEKTKLAALKMRQEEADRSAKAKQDAYEHSEEGRLQTAMGQNLAKDIAETASGIDKAAREAKPIIDEFENYKKILESKKVTTGLFGPARHAANKLAVESGYASPETEQAARFGDLIKSGGLRQMLIQMGGRLGAGISDADRRAIEQTSIGLEQNQQYNIDMIDAMINMQKRAQAMGKFTEDYRKEHNGHLDAGYTAALSEWANKQPNVTSKKLRESLGTEGGSATSSVSGNVIVNPKTGEKMRLSDDGKSWVKF